MCAACGASNSDAAHFCYECGTGLPSKAPPRARVPSASPTSSDEPMPAKGPPGETSSERAPSSATSPRAYTPAYLIDKILNTRSAIEGERKLVTVLFVDIADSSTLAQGIDPERLHELMGEVLHLAAEAVHRYEGTVNQYLGDGLMALFGAPIAVEDHPLRAVQAALAIQETIRGYSAQLAREHGAELRFASA